MTVNQNDILRVTAEMSIGVNDVQNVFHYQYVAVADVTDALALLDSAVIMETLYDIILSDIGDALTFDQVRVKNVTQNTLLGSTPFPVLIAGTELGAPLPLPDAALITYPTAVPRTRGGTYFGGFTEIANVEQGNIASATVTRLLAVGVRALQEQNIAGRLYQFVLINRLLGTVIPLTSAIVHPIFRTQRRRRPGVGS